MVVVARKQLEQSFHGNEVDNVNILGVDQGGLLLFSATSSNAARAASVPRTVIGGMQLSNGEQRIYHRHPSAVRITHASINASRSLCCFVTRTETYDVYVAEISSSNPGRLYSLRFSRSSPIRAYLAPHDVILLFYKDAVTVFRMPNSANAMERSVAVDRDAQLSDCIYYQWDTLQQRLHIVQKRPLVSTKTVSPNEGEPLVCTTYTVNARGQFDSIMKADFNLQAPAASLSQGNFEILSNESSLFLCWQLTMDKETQNAEYAVVSLGHGRTFYLSKSLNKENWERFKSRKIHFGLLDGDYVFAILRGEFTHLLNFNVQLHSPAHLFFPNDPESLPYDIKYTSQRGLTNKIATLLYERRNLVTYTVEISADDLLKAVSPTTIYGSISYAIIASKDPNVLQHILEKILFHMYDDLNTKHWLMEIMTALIFMRLARRLHNNNKYSLLFPATTMDSRRSHDTEVLIRFVGHHREYAPVRSSTTNLDQDYLEKLRTSFYYMRRYSHKKLPYVHPIMTAIDENELRTPSFDNPDRLRRSFPGFSPIPQSPPRNQRPMSPRSLYTPPQDFSPSLEGNRSTHESNHSSNAKRNDYLLKNVSAELNDLKEELGQDRIKTIAYDYVQTTQSQCDFLTKSFTRLAKFHRAQGFHFDDENSSEAPSEKYKTLLVVIEKLYLAVVEMGFAPTAELQRTLLEVSFRVMPFNRFIAAVDQNILTLTQDFVQQVITELDNDPKSYSIKEQLILMLPNNSGDSHSNLFDSIENNRAKRMSAQILVARSYLTDRRSKNSNTYDPSNEIHVDEIANVNNSHSRLIEQAAVTFYRDCCGRNTLDREELRTVKSGLLTLASSAL